jgi:Cu(I)/Ag(I) efflux system membrane protein CusA/SilA
MKRLIDAVIGFSVRNRFIVLLLVGITTLWGTWCLYRTPVDAIPDLSENQVIVWADWPGRSPREVEDQISYPLSVNLQGLAGVKAVRATSEFGFSMINVIFEDGTDFYFARQRVLEKLSTAGMFLPMGVVPYMAPDATALGQIFWYTVEGEGRSLDELRATQDWVVRYALGSVPGVAEVAGVGGFVREYQVDVDPGKLRAYGLTLGQVFSAVQSANSSVGGKVLHKGGSEYLVRGTGWLQGIEDLRSVMVAERRGVPITVEELGAVQIGPAFRRSVLEKDGREAVGGVVMMRYGENPLEVTGRIKKKIQEIQPALPEGVRIVPFYDRTALIHASIATLTGSLVEEIVVASLVVFLVLRHVRSAIVVCVTLPLAVLVSFIFMYLFRIPSNIMSLSGIAISIGVLIDAGIVMTENAYHRLHDRFGKERVTGDTREIVLEACKVVGGPLFFSILIMLLSFAPIFVLGGMEGRMFNPLAWTKSFALLGVAVLAITLVPALLPWFVRGRLRGQDDVRLVRSFSAIYRPMLDWFLKHPDLIVVLTGLFLVVCTPFFPRKTEWTTKVPYLFPALLFPLIAALTALLIARHKLACLLILAIAGVSSWKAFGPLGEEFMPPLDELALMDMPTSTPNINITQAGDDLKERDAVLKQFPEVHQVVGKVGRAETSTDPAPVDMVETVVSLRPAAWWPKRSVVYDEAAAEGREVAAELVRRGILKDAEGADVATMDAVGRFDRMMRELALRRLKEFVPEKGRGLAQVARRELVDFLRRTGQLAAAPDEASWTAWDARAARLWGRDFDEWILREEVKTLVDSAVEKLALERKPLLADPPGLLDSLLGPVRTLLNRERPDLVARIHEAMEVEHDRLMRGRVKVLNWELADRAPAAMTEFLVEEAVKKAREQRALLREPAAGELHEIRDARAAVFGKALLLWPRRQDELRNEMDSELQQPGWGNIWTRPIQNRVDMLATGVRTMVGVKISGESPEDIQKAANEVAEVLKQVRGAVDVFPDQVVGENYLEIEIDRRKAARYGVNVRDLQDAIEVALGGKEITATLEGRRRFPVRVRTPRDFREDEEQVGNILVAAGSAAGAMGEPSGPPASARQIPLSQVADVRIVPGPSMIKSENGKLRAYVQLNVRNRDIVGFVDEARQSVDALKLPAGVSVAWSGQFEHQVRAQDTLSLVFPMVFLIIFVILYLTYKDLPDTFMMFLAVPGAVAGGAIAQKIAGYPFSTAVQVGYIACFGLATETAIVMLVYLREAVERRGGLGKIGSEEELKAAVMEGAVARLRPKLLTEGTTILALIPMLWATGVGAEFMKPMAVPILGGILVADEVIDVLIPVLFFHDRRRRLRMLRASPEAIP